MFGDARSKRVVLVAHCVLNQNAKMDRCARYPGVMRELTQALVDAGVGLLQMPCPELMCLGLDRQADPHAETTVASEDTRVDRRMREDPAQTRCNAMALDLVYQIGEYQRNGFRVLGVIGSNGSPTCGVEAGWSDGQERPEPGALIRALMAACDRAGINLPIRGIRAAEPAEAVRAVRELLNPTQP